MKHTQLIGLGIFAWWLLTTIGCKLDSIEKKRTGSMVNNDSAICWTAALLVFSGILFLW